MHVAILGTRGIPAQYGGFETFAEELSTRLVEKGHHVTVYAESDQLQKDAVYRGVTVRHVKRRSLGKLSVVIYDVECLWDARKRFDLVYMLGYGAAWACWLPRLWGTRVWINIDGLEWARSKWSLLARKYLRLMQWFASWTPNHVIADAKAIQNYYNTTYPKGVVSTYIPYGAYPESQGEFSRQYPLIEKLGLQPHQYALVVARLEPENHIAEIVEAFSSLKLPIDLVVVGSIDSNNIFHQKLMRSAGGSVRFLGGIYNKEKLTALRLCCTCYVHGHSVGGTNPSLLEAMASGNIIVAHDNVFNREVAGDNAFYFKDSKDLIKTMIEISSLGQSKRVDLGQSMLSRATGLYDWEKIVDQYENLAEKEISTS